MQEGEMNDTSEKFVESVNDKPSESRQLLEEIRELESKILEVTNCYTDIPSITPFGFN